MLAAVTGGTGFIGSVLVEALSRAGHRVRVLTRQADPALPAGVETVRGDLFDEAALRALCAGADALFHLAADLSFWRGSQAAQDRLNVLGTDRLLRVAARCGVRRVVHTSSMSAIGIPPAPGVPADESSPFRGEQYTYLRSKKRQEEVALAAVARLGLDVVVVSPGLVFGGSARARRASGSQRMIALVERGMTLYPPGGTSVCDVDDVVRGHFLALERGRTGERYLLTGHNVKMRDLFAAIARELGRPAPRWQTPVPLMLAAGAGAELVGWITGRMPALTWDHVVLGTTDLWFDCSKARRELGYSIAPLDEIVRKAVAAHRARVGAPSAAAA